jgi:hypothetical protein
MVQKVVLKFRRTHYTREGHPEFTVLRSDWDPLVAEWLWPAMKHFERSLSLTAKNVTVWDQLRHGLPGLIQVFSWPGFTAIPVDDLEVEDVRDLFMDIDDTFHREWGPDRGALRSSGVRQFLLNYLLHLRPDGTLLRAKGSFVPKGRAAPRPRQLISDQIVYENEVPVQGPVGALPHGTPAELRTLTKDRLESDFERIAQGCLAELTAFEFACGVIDEIRDAPIDLVNEKSALEKIQKNPKSAAQLSSQEKAALTAYYIRLDNAASSDTPQYLGSTQLEVELTRKMGIQPSRFLKCVRYRCFPNQSTLVAAMVLIQINTAWNISAVMALSEKLIQEIGSSQYLIQSIKSKTLDDTPQVLWEGHDHHGVIALRFALNRLTEIRGRGWAAANETQLWLSPRIKSSNEGLPVSNLSTGLRELIRRHSLPKFTFEQLRVQALTIISLTRGPIAAAEAAGHAGFATIGGYIDHLVTQRINSSVNLEFQKRWEHEVAQRLLLGPQPHSLMATGDGSSCSDPQDPPDEKWLRAGVCNSENCHKGEGCQNRVLVIDRDRVKEVVLTRQYYDTNWNRLYAGNPQAFLEIHVPRIEFNFYLFHYLKKSPYRSVLDGLSENTA